MPRSWMNLRGIPVSLIDCIGGSNLQHIINDSRADVDSNSFDFWVMVAALKYEMKDVIGKGGYGVVYKGHDLETDQIVAIKKMYASDLNNSATMQEISLLKEMEHANIVNGKLNLGVGGLKSHVVTLYEAGKLGHTSIVDLCKDLSTLEGTKFEGELQEFANHAFTPMCSRMCLMSSGVAIGERTVNVRYSVSLRDQSRDKRIDFLPTVVEQNFVEESMLECFTYCNMYVLNIQCLNVLPTAVEEQNFVEESCRVHDPDEIFNVVASALLELRIDPIQNIAQFLD
ncbi:Cell division control protein 15 [Camellia lanceoleosa]|uniref:Cell division control protein 15 n=1 Tax=Camellia lanceoleosa TaxID=1840588 RepID=A0ACC0G050_9ERIC|nr:Cell division control protein 15 [Camellia lanceoleosa]